MTDTPTDWERVESFCTTKAWPWAEKPFPPYFLSMIMPRNPFLRM
jgi:hypothetical protein